MMMRRLALMLLLAVTAVLTVVAETYPAQYRVNTTLNVREGAGTWYGKVGRHGPLAVPLDGHRGYCHQHRGASII